MSSDSSDSCRPIIRICNNAFFVHCFCLIFVFLSQFLIKLQKTWRNVLLTLCTYVHMHTARCINKSVKIWQMYLLN